MTGDVQRQYYARKAKTDAQNRVFDKVVGAKRRRLDSKRRVFVGNGVANEGSNTTSNILLQLDDGDRISNLPQDVVHCILEHLSVHDAARTSVLSKTWRYKWGMKNNLVLDRLFFLQLISNKDKDAYQSVFTRAIEMIILVHTGPILSFNLYIPPKLDQCRVSRWLEHFVINKRVRVLEILFSEKNAYEIPLFACQGLVELKLTTCRILTPLPKLGTTFTNLIRVELVDISITADISFGSQVKALSLHGCTGIQHLGCQFTNANSLTNLLLGESEQIDWQWFEFTKQLEVLGLSLTKANPNKRMPVNLIKLLSNIPTISALSLSGYTLEVLGPLHSMSKGPATKIENLKLIGLGFRNLGQISNSLCLIRCLPNLRILQIVLEPGERILNLTAEQILEPQRWKGVLLDKLYTVAIQGVVFEDNLLQFIKVLLASSPSLRVIFLYCNIKADAYAEIWNIRERLLQFLKKSLSAKLYLSFLEPGRLRLA